MLILGQRKRGKHLPLQSCLFAGRKDSGGSQKSQIAFATSVKLNVGVRGCQESRAAHIKVLHWSGERSDLKDIVKSGMNISI